MFKHQWFCGFAVLAGLLLPVLSYGQNWPTKPIRLIVPFAPGGNTDIIARAIAPKMTQELGQQILIDNRGGAGSTLGTGMAVKSPPDGYTIVMVSAAHVINPGVRKSLPYDSINDFAPVTLVADVPNGLAVHPSLPVRDIKQLVALAKARPGQLVYATPGHGTSTHLSIEMLSHAAGLKMLHVPYKGVGPATMDVVSGQAQMIFAALPAFIEFVRAGRLRMIAQASVNRSPAAPDVPTMIEQGYKDFIVSSGFGMFAPAKTPVAIVQRLNQEMVKVLNQPDTKQKVLNAGSEVVASTPAQFDATVKSEMARLGKVIKEAGIREE